MPQTTYEKHTDCVYDFWQQVAKFFLMSAIYSCLKSLRYRQTSSGNVENLLIRFRSPLRDLFL